MPSLQMKKLRSREVKVHRQKVGKTGFEPRPLAPQPQAMIVEALPDGEHPLPSFWAPHHQLLHSPA